MDRMNDALITCALVDERDLDTRYLAGTLPEPEAEAFEAHYFGCERCWALVRRGSEVRAALTDAAEDYQASAATPVLGLSSTPGRRGRVRLWMGLAAAGVGVAVGLTLWQAQQTPPEDAVRGGTGALSLTAEARGDSLYAVWPRVTGAAQYRLRLFTSDGVILLEREVADTALVLPASALPAGSELAQTLAQVQAENELREPLARSELEAITSGPHQ